MSYLCSLQNDRISKYTESIKFNSDVHLKMCFSPPAAACDITLYNF